jgi:hypothetical protein
VTQPAQPYDDRLSRLLAQLTGAFASAGLAPGQWTHGVLTHSGYYVALTVREDSRRIVAISRVDRPGNIRAWDRHHESVALTKEHMEIRSWQPIAPRSGYAGVREEFLEPSMVTP